MSDVMTMPTPNADTVLLEIDKLAQALACPHQRLRLAILRAQVAQLVREARVMRRGEAPGAML